MPATSPEDLLRPRSALALPHTNDPSVTAAHGVSRRDGDRRTGGPMPPALGPATIWLVPAGAAMACLALVLVLVATDGLPPAMALHAGLMITAWNILLPAGAVVARHFKVTRGQGFPAVLDNRFWWIWHRRLQYAGVLVATFAFALILTETHFALRTGHAWLGLLVLIFGWAQLASGLLRGSKGGPTDPAADPMRPATWRGDHFDMTTRRRVFEFAHKGVGWTVLALACVAVLTGIDLVGSPAWFLIAAGGLHAGIVASLINGTVRRRWVDTYEAIWGIPPPPLVRRKRKIDPFQAPGERLP